MCTFIRLAWIIGGALILTCGVIGVVSGARFLHEYRVLAVPTVGAAPTTIGGWSFAVTPPPATRAMPSLLSGMPCPSRVDRQLVAAMIENTPASRPQMRGLVDAPIVYEAMAEGGITRFLAIFDCQPLTRVGPIRSARPYYVDWAAEYGAGYLHAGGSPAALTLLDTAPVYRINEDGAILFRDEAFPKPHNLFADLTKFRTLLADVRWRDTLTTPRFGAMGLAAPVSARPLSGVTLHFSNADFRVDYTWDTQKNVYVRHLGGVPHVDADGRAITPTNLIVQFTDYGVIEGDAKSRLDFRTTGEGTAWFFSRGKYWTGVWRKPIGTNLPTSFFDSDGVPVSLSVGQTWIEVIDNPANVVLVEPSVSAPGQ